MVSKFVIRLYSSATASLEEENLRLTALDEILQKIISVKASLGDDLQDILIKEATEFLITEDGTKSYCDIVLLTKEFK